MRRVQSDMALTWSRLYSRGISSIMGYDVLLKLIVTIIKIEASSASR